MYDTVIILVICSGRGGGGVMEKKGGENFSGGSKYKFVKGGKGALAPPQKKPR